MMTLLRQPSHLHMPWQWSWPYLKSCILRTHMDLIAFEEVASFCELESDESAMISVNLWDHTTDVWDARLLVRDIECLEEQLARKRILLTHPLECWEKPMLRLTPLNSICEADSSSNDVESRCLRCMSILRFLVNNLSEALAKQSETWEHLSKVQWPNEILWLWLDLPEKAACEEPDHKLHDLSCLTKWAHSWWFPWSPSLNCLEDLPDTTLKSYLGEVVALDLLLIDHYWLTFHWSPECLPWASWSCWSLILKGVVFSVTRHLICWGWGSPGGG